MKTNDQIRQIVESILPNFIPKNSLDTELVFHFTIPPKSNYKVWFKKSGSEWIFERYEDDNVAM